ncbi:hypothetical protein [Streptomyces sp. NBC_01803]|uniref:hypothetical protein n=1 Tax=Streptomyces sp. NBC_01803 TaxID=2975946 RepID=UPI002DDBBF34|nr:hypothetical protein [Streptomyces sp. NBC_01803]WSA47414.1 hypothetical protein OIE51_26530 [Streptomyces sp. NBC_01803]
MVINRPVAGGSPGYGLLIAATPAHSALVDVGGVLPALAAVAPGALLGPAGGFVVQLVGPGDPQAVLASLRTAAAHDGPLTLLVVGQLTADRHGRPHLALARTTPRTIRYTALPWAWLATELRDRPAGATVVVADLTADAGAWERRETLEAELTDGGPTVCGTLAPPPPRRRTATPRYAHALAAVLRGVTVRPPLQVLHQLVLQHAGLDTDPGDRLILPTTATATATPDAGATAPARTADRATVDAGGLGGDDGLGGDSGDGQEPGADPHAAIRAAVRAGHHDRADALATAHEEAAVRAGGPHAPDALHWAEVRADLAWLARQPQRAAGLWIRAARARLTAGQQPADPAVVRAVDQAHHCWQRITDTATALDVGAELAPLRRQVPGPRPGALAALHEHLAQLRRRARTRP